MNLLKKNVIITQIGDTEASYMLSVDYVSPVILSAHTKWMAEEQPTLQDTRWNLLSLSPYNI